MLSNKIRIDHSICATPAVPSAEVHNEILLMNTGMGRYYSLDDIGTRIYKKLGEPVAVSSLCTEMALNYQLDIALVETDILNFLQRLLENDLITVLPGIQA